ncbi:hypothetical protein [uncultured Gilliamella sp.]|uniref:hypothetical protein n=1 Tax=uncultured Gilliamella sp. TaxID=1193505 RepID=UPI0025E2CDB3|nr:hypothetical protein [uncultured Gilliamella sp.]
MKKMNLNILQEKARLITIKELEKYNFPHELYQYMVLDILFYNKQEHIFILHIPGISPSDSIVISSTRINVYTGEGFVEYVGLNPLNFENQNKYEKNYELSEDFLGKNIAIPIQNKLFVTAQVVYESHIFYNQILLGVYGNPVRFNNTISCAPELPSQFLMLIYTSNQFIKNKHWSIIEGKHNKICSQTLARRIITENLWLNDILIRKATSQDKLTFDVMEIKSKEEVENTIQTFFKLL